MWFLIRFFLGNAFRSRRIIWLSLLGLLPVVVGGLLLLVSHVTGEGPVTGNLFLDIGLALYVHILLPLLAAVIGCNLVAEEVDARTLPYILTRPIPPWLFAAAKMLAGCMTIALILGASLLATYTVVTGSEGVGSWIAGLKTLLGAAGVLALGCLAYTALFGLFGASFKRSVLISMVFAFGWEKIVAFMPSRIKLLTIVTYLNDLYPGQQPSRAAEGIEGILGQLSHPGGAHTPMPALVLLVIFLVCTALISALLFLREYDFDST